MVRRNKVYSLCWRSKPYKQNIHFIKHNEQKGLVTVKFCKVNRNKEGDHQMHILGSFRKKKSRLCQRCTRRCNDINRVVHSIKDGATLLFLTKIKLALYYFHVTQQECVTYSARWHTNWLEYKWIFPRIPFQYS